MKLLVEIPDHHYANIKALDSVSLGRIPYKGIIMYSINAIRNGQPLPEDCEILTKEAYEDLCLMASKEQEDGISRSTL